MASSAAPSAISRYRPAVLVITGLAAAYGSYLVYSSLTNTGSIPQKSGRLHRSNAVHRPGRRRRHSVSMFSFRQPADGGLGQLHCQHGERKSYDAKTHSHQLKHCRSSHSRHWLHHAQRCRNCSIAWNLRFTGPRGHSGDGNA